MPHGNMRIVKATLQSLNLYWPFTPSMSVPFLFNIHCILTYRITNQDPVADWGVVARLLESHKYIPNLAIEVCLRPSILHRNVDGERTKDHGRSSLGAY